MTEPLDKYVVLLSYLEPVEGAILLPATSKDDAMLKTVKLYDNRLGLNIVDVNKLSDIPGADPNTPVTDTTDEPEVVEDLRPTATIIPFPKKNETSNDK